MNNGFIAVLDSGIGGISVLKELVKAFPNESFLYLGDNDNAPYGNKNLYHLLSITIKNIDLLKSYHIKAIVLACNTLSVNLIKEIKEYSNLEVFGIFPPVESCLLKKGKTLLLATEKTAINYKKSQRLDVVGLCNLVDDIESNIFSLNCVDFIKNLRYFSTGDFNDKKGYYNHLILGCTHYNFIKNQITDHFQPQKITDGTTYTISALCRYLKKQKSLEKNKRFSVLFIGSNAKKNQAFYYGGG